MVRFAKQLGLACLMLLLVQQAGAFTPLGSVGGGGDDYQVPELSYDLPGIDISAPKNLGEEYRLTCPVLYWAVDSSFLDYFGSNGVRAVEGTYALLNQLTNVSSYSADLSEFPLDSYRINYLAQSLQMMDLKSTVLGLTLEHMGLDSPDRWSWALRFRDPLPGTCIFAYGIIQRNFDPITWQPTRYVNGTMYSYRIVDFCPAISRADAFEVQVDPLTLPSTAVASFKSYPFYPSAQSLVTTDAGLLPGVFYFTLTRDDVAGLRYLYRSSNVNFENVPTDTLQFQTNANPEALYGSNLTLLAAQALTNSAAQLQALYPGLVILTTTNYLQVAYVTNYTAYYTNSPYDPYGTAPRLVIVPTATPYVQTYYVHTFGNIGVSSFTTNGWQIQQVTDINGLTNRVFQSSQITVVTNSPYAPVDSLLMVTNVTTRTYATNVVAGEFFILPTNTCALAVLANLLTNITVTTNFSIQATNIPTGTNIFGTTNMASVTVATIDYFTNHAMAVLPVQCVTNSADLRQGIERIRFVRADYDSLLGRFFRPITNDYSLTAVVNNSAVVQNFRRVVTSPDIEIRAIDLNTTFAVRSINFQSNAVAGLAGPGSIEPAFTIGLNRVGPMRLTVTGFMDEATVLATNFVWASFDGTTNDPIVYPSGASIQAMENQILIQVSPMDSALPDGTSGVGYLADFSVVGGQPPYAWAAVGALPPGLELSANTTNSAVAAISGTSSAPGVYQFSVRVTDYALRFVDRPYTIRINP